MKPAGSGHARRFYSTLLPEKPEKGGAPLRFDDESIRKGRARAKGAQGRKCYLSLLPVPVTHRCLLYNVRMGLSCAHMPRALMAWNWFDGCQKRYVSTVNLISLDSVCKHSDRER